MNTDNKKDTILIRDLIIESFPEETFLFADNFDPAIIGVCTKTLKVVYSKSKCIDILSRDMSPEEAVEYFDFNVDGSYMGDQTPIFVEDFLY